jgi:hypothetical protein
MSHDRPSEWTPKRIGLLLLVCAAGALAIGSLFVDVPDALITVPFAAVMVGWVVHEYRRDPSRSNRRWLVAMSLAAGLMLLGTAMNTAGF